MIDGRCEKSFKAGHILGSINFPIARIIDKQTMNVKPADEKRAILQHAGVDLAKDITCASHGGITATVLYGALKDVTTGKISVYDGSWAEFSKNKKKNSC